MSENENREDATQAFTVIKPGAVLSKYEILRKLGAGGMGDVFLAHDSKLKRQVALKFLSPAFASDDTFSARFIREAQSAAALNHPNVVTIFEVAEYEGHIFIAMEYVEGKSLRDLIDGGHLTYNSGLAAAIQICDGLGAAHQARLVHRDIKPLNIIVDAGDRVRILDFGLAKAEDDMHLTQAGMTIGTVNYMSPEQGKGEEADCKSDIFSLGIVLYEMFTGQLPFKKGNIPSTIYSIVNDQPEPITKHNSTLPAVLQDIINKALAKDPTQRYTSVLDLKNDLLQLQGSSRISQYGAVQPVAAVAPKVKSLAVLYLRNLGSEEDEFLSYGITEDLIVDLTRIGSVRVASMRSILKYKDSEAELEEIAAKLNVDMILDGSIHKAGNSIRISAQLVDVHSGENLWAERWQESSENLPQIKQALADGISRALDIGNTVIMQADIGKPEARDAGAYENYLKAKYNFNHKKDRSDVNIALGLYSLAIKEEPSLLAAKVGIAEIMIYNGDFTSAEIELESALKVALQRNLRADHVDILRLLAQLYVKQSIWTRAQEYCEKALELAREMGDLAGEAAALGIMISILQPQAKFDEAILLFDRVLEISRQLDDQEQVAEALKNMGIAYSRKGDYEQALDLYNECLEMARSRENLSLQASCLSNIGNVNYYRSRFDLAFQHYEQALEISIKIGDKALSARQNLNMGLIHLMTGKYKDGLKLLDQAAESFKGMADRGNYALTLVNISQARLTLGEFESAVSAAREALDIAREIHHPLVETDALVQIGSAYFFNRDIEPAVKHFQMALEIAEKSNMSRNIAHIHLALVNICYYCKDFDNCRNHATKALSISREIGEKTAMILSNAGLAAINACEGLYSTGLKKLQDAYNEIEKVGNQQMSIHLKALLGEILLKHGKSDKDKNDGREMLHAAHSLAIDKGLVPEIKLIDEIMQTGSTV